MPGIYIHIPYCRRACHYCDFHFSISLKNKNNLLAALKKEIFLQKNYLETEIISTIYFGGGTPSILSVNEIMTIYSELKKYFTILPNAEITLEANPDDLTEKKFRQLVQTPINRLSIGIQSFSDQDLKFLNRTHHSKTAITSVKNAKVVGFRNINIDLIYGIQTLTNEQWRRNIEHALNLDVPHISCYSLTIEPRTTFHTLIKKGKIENISSEKSAEQFEIVVTELKKNNFIHYEISNFAKEGFISMHNSNYWQGEKYLGLGPSAHSYNGISRQWNVRSNSVYISSLFQNKIPCEKEILTEKQKYNEYIMTNIRTIWGIDLNYVRKTFGEKIEEQLVKKSQKYISINQLFFKKQAKNSYLLLTESGKLFADRIASDLFMV